jgi:3-dehydroquinate dehydratase-2
MPYRPGNDLIPIKEFTGSCNAALRKGLRGADTAASACLGLGKTIQQISIRKDAPMKRVMILNGPNLNMLGIREPHIYGTTTLAEVNAGCEEAAAKLGLKLAFHQSNHEGVLVDLIQSARQDADAIVINPAGLSFTSVSIMDAIKTFEGPVLEVHISNIHARDEYHRHSKISFVASGVICGLGPFGYIAALHAIANMK